MRKSFLKHAFNLLSYYCVVQVCNCPASHFVYIGLCNF